MSNKIIDTSSIFDSLRIRLETDPILTVGDVVRLLLAKGIDPEVSYIN